VRIVSDKKNRHGKVDNPCGAGVVVNGKDSLLSFTGHSQDSYGRLTLGESEVSKNDDKSMLDLCWERFVWFFFDTS
jgi:hypothetical protein